jgi:hypothetical protein
MRLELVAAGCAASADADAEFLSSWIVGCVCSMHVLADFRNALDLGVTAKHKLILESSSLSFVDEHRATVMVMSAGSVMKKTAGPFTALHDPVVVHIILVFAEVVRQRAKPLLPAK